MSRTVLVARLDSMGDVLICGPAVRAVAAKADRVIMLAGPLGADAARLLPGVAEVITFEAPWVGDPAASVDSQQLCLTIEEISRLGVDEALILTSFHQTALPTALMLRLAGVPLLSAVSVDYPGSLLDTRLAPPDDGPEPVRMLTIAAGAGFPLPPSDNGALAVRLPPGPDRVRRPAGNPYVVAHPGAAVPARRYPSDRWAAAVRELAQQGWSVVITGSQAERSTVAEIVTAAGVGDAIVDLSGQLTLAALADVLAGAAVVIVGNTGPAHLAAAVATPVVSLFSPVVSAIRWAPYGVPVALLGDQQAPCRATRSRTCPIEGHPCLAKVGAGEIVDAVARLTTQRPLARLVPVLGGSR